MKRAWIVLAGLSTLAYPLAAGESPKCEMETGACIREMVAHIQEKGWMGIEVNHEAGEPARITKVVAGGPAEAAGFRAGDEFLALNGVPFESMGSDEDSMRRTKQALRPGDTVRFTVRREGRPVELTVVPIEVPRHILAQWIGQHILDQHLETAVAATDAPPEEGGGKSPGTRP